MSSHNFSIVEYHAEREGYHCGYCKSTNTCYNYGMWAYNMTVQDYQDLIDRGWRRSGEYCYKPRMDVTCCPMYTIRCSALALKVSKSQKKVLRRFHRYLADGCMESVSDTLGASYKISIPNLQEMSVSTDSAQVWSVDASLAEGKASQHVAAGIQQTKQEVLGSSLTEGTVSEAVTAAIQEQQTEQELGRPSSSLDSSLTEGKVSQLVRANIQEQQIQQKITAPSWSADPSLTEGKVSQLVIANIQQQEVIRPPCKKAKLLRLELKKLKLVRQGYGKQEVEQLLLDIKKAPPQVKSLEDFLNEPLPETPAHKLELKIVLVDSQEFQNSLNESHELFAKYQMSVHKESPEECTMGSFLRFLVHSPLQPSNGYGSFHQQYWLDGRLVAVGVIDILPRCVSSVYFFYDPDLSQLSLGTYGSLQELALVRLLHGHAPDLKFYYMGFYIHSCPKMRYKARYQPSFLLCPETYTWHPLEKCTPKLDVNKYCRFEENPTVTDTDGTVVLNEVLVLLNGRVMPYFMYQVTVQDPDDVEETKQYASLVGMNCARQMFLVKKE